MARILVLTAVAAERDAVLGARVPAVGSIAGVEIHRAATPAGLLDVAVTGVGPIAAAVTTGRALRDPYDLVVFAGVAGGFAMAPTGSTVVASAVVHADLGADSDDGWTSASELGLAPTRHELDRELVGEIADRTRAICGAVLTVSTVTGTRSRADELLRRHPDAVAEGMEGYGAYTAATRAGAPFAEIRSICNPVGPRDRGAWKLTEALAALSSAMTSLLGAPLTVAGPP